MFESTPSIRRASRGFHNSASLHRLELERAVVPGLPVSVSAWVWRNAWSGTNAMVTQVRKPTTNNYFYLAGNGTSANFRCRSDTADAVASASGLRDRAWNHVAGVSSSSTSHLCYVNGVPGTEVTTDVTPLDLTKTQIGFGTGPTSDFFPMDGGWICEVCWWATALSEGEVQALARGAHPRTVSAPYLRAYWPLGQSIETSRILQSDVLTITGTTLLDGFNPHRTAVLSRRRLYFPSAAAGVTFEQEGFRWRYDDGDEDGATFSAAQDEPSAASIGITKRLRVLVDVTGNPGSPAAEQFQLQYRRTGSPTEDWKKVN